MGIQARVRSAGAAVTLILMLLPSDSWAQSPQPPSEYILAPGDSVEIAVVGQPALTQTVTVRPDGKITFLLVGDLSVAGLTAAQTVNVVTAALRKYMRHPEVTVTITKFAPLLVYVGGDGVNKPGSFQFEPGWTVLEALASAGGLATRADLKKAVLIRRGVPQPEPLDLERLVREKDQAANVALQPGDVIQVPLLDLRVAVLGEVHNPGVYDLNPTDRIADAVARAGGYTDHAKPGEVGLIRQTDGKLNLTTYTLGDSKRIADPAQNPLVQTRDIVYVPRVAATWKDIFNSATTATLLLLLFHP